MKERGVVRLNTVTTLPQLRRLATVADGTVDCATAGTSGGLATATQADRVQGTASAVRSRTSARCAKLASPPENQDRCAAAMHSLRGPSRVLRRHGMTRIANRYDTAPRTVIPASPTIRNIEGHSRDDGWRQDQPPNISRGTAQATVRFLLFLPRCFLQLAQQRRLTGGELAQCLALQAVHRPFVLRLRACCCVEVDCRLVPVQHRPLETTATFGHRLPRQMPQQRLAGT